MVEQCDHVPCRIRICFRKAQEFVDKIVDSALAAYKGIESPLPKQIYLRRGVVRPCKNLIHKLCMLKVCPAAGTARGLKLRTDGSWYRCCGGRVRRLMDCCGYTNVRINGDAALVGYCYAGRHVFCVQYYETMMPC